ncbi:MAG: Ig-like domain-containing protein [Planctomycetales bacterium]|nr:Ig-like domain-containing protein [Planctomycetales bacterium]
MLLQGVPAPDLAGPTVIESTPDAGHPGPIDQIDLIFSEPIQDGTFTVDDVASFDGPGGAIPINSVDRVSESHYRITFPLQDAWGTYQLVVLPDIFDLAGNPLDQDGDGNGGDPILDRFELAFEIELWQDASTVIDFSSQYSATSWSAAQAIGGPDTLVYADSRTAWAPSSPNGNLETLTVGFAVPVRSTGAIIRETYGNGFVVMVEAREVETGLYHVVSTEPDGSQPGTPVDHFVTWPMTQYDVDAIRITIDTNHTFGFEEIDAVKLRGVVAPDTTGPRIVATNPDTAHSGPIDHIDLIFSEPIDPATFTVADVASLVGPNGSISVDAIQQVSDDTYRMLFATQNDFGNYSFIIGPEISDVAGNLMDQNENGIQGEPVADRFTAAFDVELWQYASTVIAFSSQYSPFGWSASDALGAPNTFAYGDARTAWAPRYANSGDQSLTVGFDTPVYSSGAVIRETFGNGFVKTIEVRDAVTGQFHVMTTGPDDSQPGTPVDYQVSWPVTTFTVDAIRITIDTTHSTKYEEIDAVSLKGVGQ